MSQQQALLFQNKKNDTWIKWNDIRRKKNKTQLEKLRNCPDVAILFAIIKVYWTLMRR